MAWRLEWFEDADIDWFTRVYTKSSIERYMDLDRIFITLTIILLFNLVLQQTTLVSWSDYFRERFLHRIEEFLVVCWLANLRNLGYNGRTIQRDFARIFFVVSLRKAYVLSLVCGKLGKEDETIELMIRTFNAFVITLLTKYRPEWYPIYSLSCDLATFTFSSLRIGVIWRSPSLGSAASIIISLVLYISFFYYDFVRRLFWDIKACERMTMFRNAWKDSYDRYPEAASQLAQTCKEICGVLSQQRDDALQTLWPFSKVQAYLEERVGRWC
jgi:hypothetical protein